MDRKPHILLLGSSIFIDSLAGSLQRQKTPRVTQAAPDAFDLKDFVTSINPDLIVYELDTQDTVLPLWVADDHEEILQLAIDLTSHQAFWVHCKREPTESMQDLCDFISREASLMLQTRK